VIIDQPCPECGGPAMPQVPYTDARRCPRGVAYVVGGRTVVHLSGWEAIRDAGSLTLLAAKEGAFLLDGLGEIEVPEGTEAA
jgi:hypothetical protein